MRLFAISDLHLSLTTDKSMDVFSGWENYVNRICKNWQSVVEKNDTVVIAGDISWGISLEESLEDFKLLDSLNGQKILLKGNHDYWWSTVSKINGFFLENNLNSLHVLHNNCYSDGRFAVCGSRGWIYDGTGEQDIKVIKRECGRLERSLECAGQLGATPVVFLHYPPAYGDYSCDEILSVLKKYGIKAVYYGHIHGSGVQKTLTDYEGIKLKLLSADIVRFAPVFIGECGIFK